MISLVQTGLANTRLLLNTKIDRMRQINVGIIKFDIDEDMVIPSLFSSKYISEPMHIIRLMRDIKGKQGVPG